MKFGFTLETPAEVKDIAAAEVKKSWTDGKKIPLSQPRIVMVTPP